MDVRELVCPPQGPCSTEEDGKQRQDEERSVDIGHEEGLGVSVIGEDSLRV